MNLDQRLERIEGDLESIKYVFVRKYNLVRGAKIREFGTKRIFVIDTVTGNDSFKYKAVKGITTGDLTDHGDCVVLCFPVYFEAVK